MQIQKKKRERDGKMGREGRIINPSLQGTIALVFKYRFFNGLKYNQNCTGLRHLT